MGKEEPDVKVVKENKSLDELTQKTFDIAINCLFQSRKNLLGFAGAMKQIRDKQLYLRRDYDSFEACCCSPEISLKPKTVESYIAIYEYWIEDQKKKMDDMAGIEFNKLILLKKVKSPEKFYHDAKVLAYGDFKKLIMEQEFKLKPDEDELDEYIKRKHPCPCWNGKKCSAGIDVEKFMESQKKKEPEKKPEKKKKDDLI